MVSNEIYSLGNMLYCLWVSKFILIPKYVWPSPLNINLANCQNYAQFVSVVVVSASTHKFDRLSKLCIMPNTLPSALAWAYDDDDDLEIDRERE